MGEKRRASLLSSIYHVWPLDIIVPLKCFLFSVHLCGCPGACVPVSRTPIRLSSLHHGWLH
jgi:hypothetical protein